MIYINISIFSLVLKIDFKDFLNVIYVNIIAD